MRWFVGLGHSQHLLTQPSGVGPEWSPLVCKLRGDRLGEFSVRHRQCLTGGSAVAARQFGFDWPVRR